MIRERRYLHLFLKADENYIDDNLVPYDWYMNHILTGAAEFNLPSEYITELKRLRTKEDTKAERKKRELGIYTTD